ncbi:hypothetical protein [Actinoplanes sp. NPDC049681]|uniref:hypothetical protein n=1 Tax=Actinoplanes sp. NPDC049681 TaxID=3363905 RepID=UPI0037B28D84
MSRKKIGLIAAGVVAVGGLALGGSTMASAATAMPAPSSSAGAAAGPGGSADAPVTGDEATKVTSAVTAKDSRVTVTGVRKDPDGSYDVFGTKAGARVMYDVSADLTAITEGGGPGRGPAN